MVVAPIKRVPDTQVTVSEAARADVDPHVSALATGHFIIGWDYSVSATDVNARFVLADESVPVQFFTSFAANSTASNERQIGMDGLASGDVALVWTDTPTATNNSDIWAAFYSATGFRVTAPFLVNVDDTAGNQSHPEVVELTSGVFAYAWIDNATNTIKAALFDSFGGPLIYGRNLTVGSNTNGSQELGLTALGDGNNFAVSWFANDGEHFRIMNNLGASVSTDITVAASAFATDIVQLTNGTIEVVYATPTSLDGRAYDPSGNPLGPAYHISTDASAIFPSATALQDGRFMVVYNASSEIFGRIMNADGTPSTDEFRVNTDTVGFQSHPTIDTLADGQVAVAWEDPRTGAGDIYYTVLDPRQSAVDVTGTSRDDKIIGSDFNDTLTGGFGSDVLKGGLGSDTFLFRTAQDGIDTISDFQRGLDHVLLGSNFVSEGGGPHPLSSALHLEYGSAASTSNPTLLFDTFNNHTVKWDSDGTGSGTPQPLARVTFANATDVVELDVRFLTLPNLNGYSVLGTGDFNNHGGPDSDIVLRNNSSGAAEIWFMGGGGIIADFAIGNLGAYNLAATGDFNHDGTDDMLWKNNNSGVVETWLMQDGLRVGGEVLGNLTGYTAIGTGDFNQDGNTDILWQNNTSGVIDLWFMGGGHVIADFNLGNLSGYSLLGVGDFNGDHTSDLVWRNNTSGLTETWQMQQGVRTGGSTLGNLTGYQLLDTGDLNHDGTDDLVWRSLVNGSTSSWAMRNGQFQGDEQNLALLPPSQLAPASGDFTGDGGKDVLLLSSGSTFIMDSEHHSLTASDFLIL